MARIPEDEIERIKASSDLVALIQSRGVTLKKQGSNWTGLCPFHEDKATPNLIVTPAKGLWRCMASGCGRAGNAIQFVQHHDGVSFRHAFELLAGGGNAAFQPPPSGSPKRSIAPRLPCPLDAGASDSELLGQVAEYYHARLCGPEGVAARDYLTSRGLGDEELLERFGVGFADRTLGLHVPNRQRVDGAELRGRLQEVGVYRPNGREHLNGCLVVPVASPSREVLQLYGRRIDPKAPKDRRHLYLARPLAGVFNPEALAAREIILTESILDAMTFVVHGMESVTCSFGTANVGDDLIEAIRGTGVESVRLAFDGDESGDTAARTTAQRLQSFGIECHRVKLPLGSDPNSYAVEQGGEALKKAVRTAAWLGAGAPRPSVSVARVPAPAPSSLAASLAAGVTGRGDELAAKEKKEAALKCVGDAHELRLGERCYRVGGLARNGSPDSLKMTLRLSLEDGSLHVDQVDLIRDGDRRRFVDRAAEECRLERDLLRRDLGKLLLACEREVEERLSAPTDLAPETPPMSAEAQTRAMKLLRSPKLIEELTQSFARAGTVGEADNLFAAYLVATSRLMSKPLAAIIQSTSAAGKSTLMEAVLAFFPPEEQIKYSAMTGQSLYYLGETNLKHKILAIVEEEGAEKASYALKLLQSEGELTIASTGKDPNTGRMETQEYHVEGPVAIVLTTTSIDIDEELMNRCLILTVDEGREQTEKIQQAQRMARTLEGLRVKSGRDEVLELMRDTQRLLRPIPVVNEFASQLTFTADRTRTRRDHEKYLNLIEAVALLHQHQRPLETDSVAGDHIRATLADIEAANRIAPEVLGRALDELPPQTRRMLEVIKGLVREMMAERELDQRLALFGRKDVREKTGWSETQVRHHLHRLEQLEYVVRRTGRNGAAMKYELLVGAEEPEGTAHIGLIDVEKLRQKPAA